MKSIYWYAPFNNAGELETAIELGRSPTVDLTVESVEQRFGRPLDASSSEGMRLFRDLPAPSGEGESRRTAFNRAHIAVQRARRRHQLVKGGEFDLIHLHTFNPVTDWVAIRLLRRHVCVVVQTVHNVRPHDSVFPKPIESVLLKLGYRSSSKLFVAHPLLRALLVDDMGVPEARIHIVPFALTMPVLTARSHVSYMDKPITFLVFGTLRNNKGIDVLLEAIDLMIARDPSASERYRFVFAGRGEPALERAVLDAAERHSCVVAEIGYVTPERRPAFYAQADCVVLPYTELQAQSGVLHDAYANRLAVIASDVRALGDTVRRDQTGWVIPPGDVEALIEAIRSAAASADDRQTAGERAGQIAEAHAPAEVASLLEGLYDQFLTCP